MLPVAVQDMRYVRLHREEVYPPEAVFSEDVHHLHDRSVRRVHRGVYYARLVGEIGIVCKLAKYKDLHVYRNRRRAPCKQRNNRAQRSPLNRLSADIKFLVPRTHTASQWRACGPPLHLTNHRDR